MLHRNIVICTALLFGFNCCGDCSNEITKAIKIDEISEKLTKKDQIEYISDLELDDDDVLVTLNATSEDNLLNRTEDVTERIMQPINGPFDKNLCPRFKYGSKLSFNKMSDVWQSYYNDMIRPVGCFKILIEETQPLDKKDNKIMYGTFNGRVNWDMCNLEIKSNHLMRKHFLQGDGSDGIMENIIIVEDYDEGNFTLVEEVSDQWLLVKNLLLLRDCQTGNIVVFFRVPYKPNENSLLQALQLFGEKKMQGKMACENDNDVDYLYRIHESDNDQK